VPNSLALYALSYLMVLSLIRWIIKNEATRVLSAV
jgi:hypothetical protein